MTSVATVKWSIMMFSSVDLPLTLRGFKTLVVCPYFGISIVLAL